jgi:beta-galactosidase
MPGTFIHAILTQRAWRHVPLEFVAIASAFLSAVGCGSDQGTPAAARPRGDQLLSLGWRFLEADAERASDPDFDDSGAGWSTVSIPHTYNALDGQDGGGNYYRGPTWYRTHLPGFVKERGRRYFLQFDGANSRAAVYVNGLSVGGHSGGFAGFRVDASDALRPGDNVVAVRVDNAADPTLPPLTADFTFFGGLYRDVHLLGVDELHVALQDDGSSGVYLSTRDVSATAAELSARVLVSNQGLDTTARVTVSLVTSTGFVGAQLEGDVQLRAGETHEIELTGPVSSPHLWQGKQDPFLYSAAVAVSSAGKRTDLVEQPFGIRSYSLDPDTGFSLNGQALDLHGVNRHQDRIDKGWAIGTAEHDEDMALILELGATAVRLAHYQQASYFYDLCDRNGLIVWAEIPLVDAVTDDPAFSNNALTMMRELVHQNYNHPSIAFWGIGNEQRTDDAPTNALLSQLAAQVEADDPGRISSYAHCCNSATANLVSHARATGYNVYYGWYMGIPSQLGAFADQVHALRPDVPIAISEYGAGAALSQHQEPAVQPLAAGPFHPEEYQALLHEQTWPQLASRRYLWGKFIWNMFDFAIDSRNEGDTPGRNDKGLVSYDRQTKKDAFYFYQANWTTAPMVHIAGRRFNPRSTETVDIKVYSNRDQVRLRVNDQPVDVLPNVRWPVYVWERVPLALGENRVQAVAIGSGDSGAAEDSVLWTRQ